MCLASSPRIAPVAPLKWKLVRRARPFRHHSGKCTCDRSRRWIPVIAILRTAFNVFPCRMTCKSRRAGRLSRDALAIEERRWGSEIASSPLRIICTRSGRRFFISAVAKRDCVDISLRRPSCCRSGEVNASCNGVNPSFCTPRALYDAILPIKPPK